MRVSASLLLVICFFCGFAQHKSNYPMHSFRLGVEVASSVDSYGYEHEVEKHFYRPGFIATYEYMPLSFLGISVMIGYDFSGNQSYSFPSAGRQVNVQPYYSFYGSTTNSFSYNRFKVIPAVKYSLYRDEFSSMYVKAGIGMVQVSESRSTESTGERFTTDSIISISQNSSNSSDSYIRFPLRFQMGMELPLNKINVDQAVELFIFYETQSPFQNVVIRNRAFGIGLAYCFDFK